MKNVLIFVAAAVSVGVSISLVLRKRESGRNAVAEVMDEKVHQLREKFMSLDEGYVHPHAFEKLDHAARAR